MTILGKKLTAKRAGCVTEQAYDNGTVTKVTTNGVFYTSFDDGFTYKWQPNKNHAGYYLRTSMLNGKPFMKPVDFLQLTFTDDDVMSDSECMNFIHNMY